MFTPACVALAVSFVQYRSWRHLCGPIFKDPRLSIIIFPLIFPVVVTTTCTLLGRLFGVATYQREKLGDLLVIKKFPLPMIFFGILVKFGEEYGWRGYLLPEVAKIRGPNFGAGVVGMVWRFGTHPCFSNSPN